MPDIATGRRRGTIDIRGAVALSPVAVKMAEKMAGMSNDL